MQHFIKSKSISIDCPDVRHEINSALKFAGSSCLTPYIGLERFRKILAPYSIFITATGYMEGESGTRIFNVFQYNALSGENEHGDIVTKTESPYYIVFSYESCCGYYSVECKLVLKNELNESVNSKLKNLLNSKRTSERPTEQIKKNNRPILTDRFRKVRTDSIAQARAENSKKTLSELRLFFEENKHPLVLKVRRHNITDAWDAIKRRHGPHKPHGSKGEHEDIQKQLKSKGIKVSTAEIEKTIRDHQQKKKKRKKILERLREAARGPRLRLSDDELNAAYDMRRKNKSFGEIMSKMGYSDRVLRRELESDANKTRPGVKYEPAPSTLDIDRRRQKYNEIVKDPEKHREKIARIHKNTGGDIEHTANLIGLSTHFTKKVLGLFKLRKKRSPEHPPEVIAKVHDMRRNPAEHGLETGSYTEIAYKMNTSGPEGSRKLTKGAVAGILGRGREKLK